MDDLMDCIENEEEKTKTEESKETLDVDNACLETIATKNEKGLKNKKKKIILFSVICAVVVAVIVLLISIFSLDETEKKAIENVAFLIYAIDDEITLDSGDKIEEAKNAYEELSEKCRFRVTNYDDLELAIAEYNALMIEQTELAIDLIGTVSLRSGRLIKSARNFYDKLGDDEKASVHNADILLNAEKEYNSMLIENVENKISLIGEVEATHGSKTLIDLAKKEYESLPDDLKKSVSTYSVLEKAINKYNALCVDECIKLIDSVGTKVIENESTIIKARNLYDSLDSSEQTKVTNYETLENVEKILKEHKMSFKVGDRISNADWEITLTKAKISHSVYPNDTSGYYYYYSASESSDMIVLQFKVKNKSDYTLLMSDFVGEMFSVQFLGKTVSKSADLYYDDNGGWLHPVYSSTGIGAYDTFYINVCLIVPDDVAGSEQAVSVTGTFCEQEKIIKIK